MQGGNVEVFLVKILSQVPPSRSHGHMAVQDQTFLKTASCKRSFFSTISKNCGFQKLQSPCKPGLSVWCQLMSHSEQGPFSYPLYLTLSQHNKVSCVFISPPLLSRLPVDGQRDQRRGEMFHEKQLNCRRLRHSVDNKLLLRSFCLQVCTVIKTEPRCFHPLFSRPSILCLSHACSLHNLLVPICLICCCVYS